MKPKTGWRAAFSLVELLIVIAVIGILSALIISSITNATEDSRLAVARQQQVVLQEALTSWVAAQPSLGDAQDLYASSGDRLALIADYLRNESPGGGSLFYLDGSDVNSAVLQKLGKRLQFSGWTSNPYPTVVMTNK